jgi:hypothetical protein
MNMPLQDIEKGLAELVKEPDGVHKIAQLIHYLLSLQECTAKDIQDELNKIKGGIKDGHNVNV